VSNWLANRFASQRLLLTAEWVGSLPLAFLETAQQKLVRWAD
jgi:hypothetical protein